MMKHRCPWSPGSTPLMLAPMQGLTNRSLRSLFSEWAAPDVLFTEFMRVSPTNRKRLLPSDRRELAAHKDETSLVAQLIGHGTDALVAAAREAQKLGADHINLNMGCPYGRMTTGLTGGGMLRAPELLPEILFALRQEIRGGFSVKVRAGFDEPRQIFSLLPLFEQAQIDFLVLHPRTVVQKYDGHADHSLTAEVVASTALPVIANGDIFTADKGFEVLEESKATGLMLGRGAVADPWLFHRLRGEASKVPSKEERCDQVQRYLAEVLQRYSKVFCGEHQILCKLKAVVAQVEMHLTERAVRRLKKSRTVDVFSLELEGLRPADLLG